MSREILIAQVVEAFYKKATLDVLIGYHFRDIKDFNSHLPRINSFWEIQLLGKPSSSIDPPLDIIRSHLPLKIKPGEVGRWIKLFKETLAENKDSDQYTLFATWDKKLNQFEQIFLQNPLLFPKA